MYKKIEMHIIEVEIDTLINASMEIYMNELLKKQQVYICICIYIYLYICIYINISI
jgi:hypothetical protein